MQYILININFIIYNAAMSDTANSQYLHTLYFDHSSWLHGWLWRRLECRDTAADITQDTFVRLLRQDVEKDSLREPRAFLTQVARGLVINHWRRCDIERACLEALAHLPASEAPSPESCQLVMESLYQIDSALQALPDPVRCAFLMAQLEGIKYKDIAQRLEVAEITVKRYIKRALVHCMMVLD